MNNLQFHEVNHNNQYIEIAKSDNFDVLSEIIFASSMHFIAILCPFK